MSFPCLRAVAPTPNMTIQDGGRQGWRRFGIPGAGPMDTMSFAIANALVGNRLSEPAIEFAYAGGEWVVEAASCRIAVAGGDFDLRIDDRPARAYRSIVVHRHQHLRLGSAPGRVWGYLAVAGGLDLPLEFGSCCTDARSVIGGQFVRPIAPNDAVPLQRDRASTEPERIANPPTESPGPLRITLGPQEDYFTRQALSAFLSEEFKVTWQQDRVAYRMEGPELTHAKGFNIISESVIPGCIQVPGSGMPIILMRDAGTNGGYPKIGTVITADLGRLAQCRPGSRVRFQAVGVEEAQAIRRQFLARMLLTTEAIAARRPQYQVH